MKNKYSFSKQVEFFQLWWVLTINLPNYLNVIIHLTFLEPSIIIFRDIKMRTWSWSATSVKPGQTAQMCRLAMALYWWQRLITFCSSRIRVNILTSGWNIKHVQDPYKKHTSKLILLHFTPTIWNKYDKIYVNVLYKNYIDFQWSNNISYITMIMAKFEKKTGCIKFNTNKIEDTKLEICPKDTDAPIFPTLSVPPYHIILYVI